MEVVAGRNLDDRQPQPGPLRYHQPFAGSTLPWAQAWALCDPECRIIIVPGEAILEGLLRRRVS